MSGSLEWLVSNTGLLTALPFLTLALLSAPLIYLWQSRQISPYKGLLILLLAPVLLSVAVLAKPELFVVVVVLDLVVVTVAAIDLLTLPGRRGLDAERQASRIASLQMPHTVTLTLTNRSRRSYLASVRDDVPEEFVVSPEEFAIRLQPSSRSILHYEFTPTRRGAYQMQQVHVRIRSLLGMWRRAIILPVETRVHVYPDMKQLSEYAILARTNRLSLMGVRRTRRIGQDNEFERLRDYTLDDNYKHIDWRTTARRNKLTVKDFQTNQSQRIIFMLDCGRMMTNTSSGLSLLDHSLNAMLMMSYVALRQGDSVGLICFSDDIHTYVPPKGGQNHMNQLLHASFDRFPQLVESRYDLGFLYLATRCKKRSLVILISNLVDEVNSLQVQQYLGTLVGRHLPLGVLLRDHRLFDAADQPHPQNIFRAAAAAEILSWRHQVLTDLEHKGVLALDVFPEDMTAPLVNRYLEIKARHLL